MSAQLAISSANEDEIWLFERVVKQLQQTYGHSEDKAVELVNSYHKKFTDPDFCRKNCIPAQTAEFFFHNESITMADRVHYYEALGNELDEEAFTQWQRKTRFGL